MEDDDLIKLISTELESEDPFSLEGVNKLFSEEDNGLKYNNLFEDREIREFISPSDTDSRYLTVWDNPFETEKIERKKEDRQPWIHKAGAGIGRVALKVGAEIAKMPGVAGGLVYGLTDTDNYIQKAFNNAWIQSIADFEEDVKNEILPVYVKKAVREGNLWDNISSVDFWATEGADGAGYIIAMLAPGAAINKFGVGAKILGTNKYAQMAAKTKNAEESIKLLQKAGATSKNADLATATFANTLFESSAEAKGAMDSYVDILNRRRLLHPEDEKYLSEEDYEEALKKQGEIGRNVFLANAAILVGPNAIMSKMLWGKTRNRTAGALVSDGNLKTLADPALKIKAGRVGKDLLYAGGREGLWEEGMQSTVEEYYTKNPDADLSDIVGDLPKAYIEMANSTDGQKAMFLGAVFGGGMQSYTGAKSRKKERANTNKLVEAGDTMLTDFYNVFDEDIYKKDDEGKVLFTEKLENGEYKQVPAIDTNKFFEKLKGVNQLEHLSAVYDLAVEKGDTEKIQEIKEVLTTHLVKPFIVNDDLGIDVLKQHLEQSSKLAKISEREKSDNDVFIANTIEKAKKLKKDYNRFQEFAPTIYNLNNENASESEKVDFYNKLSMQYLDNKARQYFSENKLQEQENTLIELIKERGADPSLVRDNFAAIRDLGKVDSRINKVYETITGLKNDLNKIEKINNSFWDNKSVVEKFNKEVIELAKVKAKESKIEDDTNKILDTIKGTNTLEDLDSIEIPENVPTEVIKETINGKRKEIQDKIDNEAQQTSDENEEFNQNSNSEEVENEEALEYIKNNFNVGEIVNLPDVPAIPEKRRGLSAEITAILDKQINFKTEDGAEFAFKLSAFANAFNNDESNYTSEGGVEDNIQTKEVDSSGVKYEKRNQPRIIITDNNHGNKLPFVDDAALEFERSPRDKIGEEKNIYINKNNDNNLNNIFPNSKIQSIVYHGGNKGITKFLKKGDKGYINTEEQTQNGIYFSSLKNVAQSYADNIKGSIYKVKLNIQNPYIDKNGTYSGTITDKDLNKLKLEGYDGIIIDISKNVKNYVAFDTTQIYIIPSINLSNNQQQAVDMIENNDFSNLEFLINNLPLNLKLTDSVVAPLETRSETSEGYNKTFDKTSRDLRRTIIKELQSGTKIEDITVPIAGQWKGTLQIEETPVENLLTDLYEFSGNIDKIQSEDIYFVDDFGALININDDILPVNRRLAKGEVYLKIKSANGEAFPLKLNVKRLTEDQAELLYELYKSRFEAEENTTVSSLGDDLWSNVQDKFADVLPLFNKDSKDITIKDLTELLVWEGSKSPKTQIKFTKKGDIIVLNKSFSKEEFDKPESKNLFIDTLTTKKRHQIKFRRKLTDNNNLNIQDNRQYLEYLIKSGTLNTNAKVGEPTFQGRTTMYLAKDKVKVNGNPSKYNKDIVKVYGTRVLGDNTSLKKKLPGLFSKTFTLNEDGSKYVDEKGVEYNRATSLKDSPFNSTDSRITNAAVRGDVVDELTRIYFSSSSLSIKDFVTRGKKHLKIINKSKDTSVIISDRYFNSLYDILEDYKEEFDNLGYTIYSNTPSIGGILGNKGNIAGTVDLLAFDNKNKKWVLIDLKTSTQDRTNEYKKEEDIEYTKKKGYSYKNQDIIQLNTYKELFTQMTGKSIERLHIMPLTSKSEDTDKLNSTFDEITKPSGDLLINIDSSKSIFKLLNIKKTVNEPKDKGTEEEQASQEKGLSVLAKLGVVVKNAPKVPKKPIPKKIIDEEIEVRLKQEAVDFYSDGKYEIYPVGNKIYHITWNYYTIDTKENNVIITKKENLRIIKAFNKVTEGSELNYSKAEEAWNSRVVENTKEVKKEAPKGEEIDFQKLSKEKAINIYKRLSKEFVIYVKDFQAITKSKLTFQDKVETMVNYLQDKNISQEQIKTKCGL